MSFLHPQKAPIPNLEIVLGKLTFIRFLQSLNAHLSISSIPSGKQISFILVHSSNASSLILFNFSGKFIVLSFLHSLNVSYSIQHIPFGKIIFFKELHLKNAPLDIDRTWSGIITVTSALHI